MPRRSIWKESLIAAQKGFCAVDLGFVFAPLAGIGGRQEFPAVLGMLPFRTALAVSGNLHKMSKFVVRSSAVKDETEAVAMASEKIQTWLEGKTVRKVIVVPGRQVNIAVS